MPAVLNPDDMADVVLAILRKHNKDRWIGEMTDLQEHVGFNAMAKDKKEIVGNGRGWKERYVMSHNSSAAHVGLFNEIEYSRDDAVVEGEIPWRYTDAHMMFDEREEAMQGGPEQIFDHVKVENARMMTSLVELAEESVWGIPDDSSDNATPWGIQYWVVKNATLGFNGGNPSGFTSGRAGVSSSTYARHKNFTGQYTDVTDTESTGLIYQMEQAADYCKWVAPAPEPGLGRSGYSKGIYTNWTTKYAMKNLAKQNNDSLGFDLSTKVPVFRGAPIMHTPYFNSDTTNPVYMIDHNHTYAKFLKGWYLRRTKVDRLPNQPHNFAVVVSLAWNIGVGDIRRNAVFYQ